MDTVKETPFRVGDWDVDPASGQISHDGNTRKLEPRVMDVLVYLASRPGVVVSREELEASVWSGRVISYDALSSSVQKLRRAFADDARQPRFIETLSKRGYRLVAPVNPTAEAGRKAQFPESSTATPPHRSRWIRAGLIAVPLVMLATLAIWLYPGSWTEPVDTPDPETAPYSIAVLPFDNLSGDPAQDYFADGMTDDLITGLARIPELFVIARDSSFFYKGQPVDFPAVAKRLNVRYVLHGSIRRAGERVRFNAQLVDTASGSHRWAEHYDGKLNEIFELQETVIHKIYSAMTSSTDSEEQARQRRGETRSPEAYDYFLHGRNRFFLYASRDENRKARELYQKALELDPVFAMAYAMLAWTHAFEAMNGWSEVREDSLAQAQALATHAIALDETLPVAYFVTGLVYRERGEYKKALVEAEKAIAYDPNYANAHVLLATLLYYTGRPQEGLEKIQKAMQLNPHHPYNYPFHLGQAYFILGRYQEAIDALEQGLETNPSSERMRVWLAAAYARSGRNEDARWEAEQVLALNPDFSLQRIRQAFPFQDPGDLEQFLNGLRTAGLAE
jgi:adenylate cyclase